MALQDDIAWFEENRAFIAKQYAGKWVLVKDQSVRGAFSTYGNAFRAGTSAYGTEPFLVKQALASEKAQEI